jgi:hypothetical protein
MEIENSPIMSIGYCSTFFLSFPSSGLGTAWPGSSSFLSSWESKLELLHSCVPKLELGNKKQKDLHPIHNIFMLRCGPRRVMGVIDKRGLDIYGWPTSFSGGR